MGNARLGDSRFTNLVMQQCLSRSLEPMLCLKLPAINTFKSNDLPCYLHPGTQRGRPAKETLWKVKNVARPGTFFSPPQS
jgi:hypothetical protein